MNKIYLWLIAALLIFPIFANAQEVKEKTVKNGKESMPAFTIKVKHGTKLVKQVLKTSAEQAGLKKAKHKHGYTIYKRAVWSAISTNKLDYYYKVKGNGRKATVYFSASKGYDNYVSSQTEPSSAMSINTFLQQLAQKIDLQNEIDQREEQLDKINKEKKQKEKEMEQLNGRK